MSHIGNVNSLNLTNGQKESNLTRTLDDFPGYRRTIKAKKKKQAIEN